MEAISRASFSFRDASINVYSHLYWGQSWPSASNSMILTITTLMIHSIPGSNLLLFFSLFTRTIENLLDCIYKPSGIIFKQDIRLYAFNFKSWTFSIFVYFVQYSVAFISVVQAFQNVQETLTFFREVLFHTKTSLFSHNFFSKYLWLAHKCSAFFKPYW